MKQNTIEAGTHPPAYTDRKGLARELCVSARTVSRWIDDGVPALEISGGTGTRRILRFAVPAVAAWLQERAERKSLNLR